VLAIVSTAVTADAKVVPGQYIVVLSDDANPAGLAKAHGLTARNVYTKVFKGFAAAIPAQAIKGLQHNPHVLWIEPDREVHAIAQTLPTGIDRIDAELAFPGVPVDADVAVIDTGIDLDHPDLNVVGGVDCRRLDKKTGQCKVGGDDDEGHGSHVSGTIGAYDNGIGVVGVAPGVRLHAVKVLDRKGSGWLSWIIQGIDWVTQNADVIDVANMSLGGGGFDDSDGLDCSYSNDAEHLAICAAVNAGVTFVVAAGNEMDDAANHTPAAFDEVITVSALADFDGAPGGTGSGYYAFSSCTEDVDDSFACFSNYGHDVDIMAPGVGIYSTYQNGGYASSSGTSMACPHVAGAAALLKADDPSLTPEQVKIALIAGGDPAPCDTADGTCDDDPDGIQEPLLKIAAQEPDCTVNGDCNDNNECTDDTCVGGYCTFTPVVDDTLCTGGICCGGTCSAPACSLDSDCIDGDDCTTDTCLNFGTCTAACSNQEFACSGVALDGCCPTGCDYNNDADCPQADPCGDGYCAGFLAGEDCGTCAADCACIAKDCKFGCCGDGVCGKRENASNCPIDCA